jgi:transposase InsO family protein
MESIKIWLKDLRCSKPNRYWFQTSPSSILGKAPATFRWEWTLTKIIVHHLTGDLRTEGPVQALKIAVKDKRYSFELIHHSVRGLQYCSEKYQQVLEKAQVKANMAVKYTPYQNAVDEQANNIPKNEFDLERGFVHIWKHCM